VSWPTESLGAICEIVSGITKDSKKQGDDYREVPYLRVANVQRLQLDLSEVKTIPAKESTIASYRLVPGDILLNEGGDRDKLGRGWIWQGQISECIHQNHVFRARIRDGKAIPKWIAYYANTNEARAYFLASGKQTTNLASISKKNLSALPVPLPPFHVQETLVAEIDTQLSRLDEAVTTLQGIQAKLKQARASILKAAVEGRLVETEAERLFADGESHIPVQDFVGKLEAERRAKLSKGKRIGSCKMRLNSPAIRLESTVSLPKGWIMLTVNDLCWDSGYGTSAKCSHEAAGDPVLRIPNIAKGRLDLTDLKKTAKPRSITEDGMVAPGDFLFVRTNGSLSILGAGCAILSAPPFPMSYASYLIRLRLLGSAAIWKWFQLVWTSGLIRRSIEVSAASSAGQNNISLSKVLAFELPMPPELEIHRILETVERRFSVLDQVESTVTASLARCGKLRQAILKRAFGG
jgi:type I restriction enzyme S subunit